MNGKKYIKDLVYGKESEVWDRNTFSSFLDEVKKQDISDLTKKEASILIEKLLMKKVDFEMICGRIIQVAKGEVGRLSLFGDLEACIHECPIKVDIHDCKDFQEYNEQN
ncbi:MAG: hypothetical protein ACTSUO_06460 [Candidatus Thorarchaeota archaeon]